MEPFRPHLKDRLRRAFRAAGEQELMRRVQRPEQITRIRQIEEQALTRKHRAERLYRELYEARVVREMKRLINERAALKRDFKFSRSASDGFDGVSLRFAAERATRQRQEQLLARIRQVANEQKRAVVGLPERTRQQQPERLRQAFARTQERS